MQAERVEKRFGGVRALREVDFAIPAGRVVGLVGDNGAGKSTLIKILAGALQPDGGRILFGGREVFLRTPGQARELGIETVHQNLALVERMDAPANIFLGREPLRRPLPGIAVVDRRRMRDEAAALLGRLAIRIDSLAAPVSTLSGGQRQSVAVSRAISTTPKVVLLDEPTAALGVAEADRVLQVIRRLREQSIGIVLISHTLQHVFAVADRIVVLHRGAKVFESEAAQTTMDDVVRHIVGG
jgi:simple sugar transport system ATP-binding protein